MKKKTTVKILYILHTSQWHGANISFLKLVKGLISEKTVKPYIYIPVNQKRVNFEYISELRKCGCIVILGIVGSSSINNNSNMKGKLSYLLNIIFRTLSLIHLFLIVPFISPDIIHTNVGVIREGLFVSKLYRIPHVWHLREYQDLDFNWKILPTKERFCNLLKKSYVVSISQGIASHFKLEKNYSVIYNPIFDKISESKQEVKKNYFLVSNRISKEKGIEDIIEAFSRFIKDRNDNFKLLIAGTGNEDYILFLKNICKKLQIENSVEFLGYVSDLSMLQSEAAALVVGSYFEGFGRMTAESILNNTLVIGRNTGGTKEIIEKTDGGLLFNSIEELKQNFILIADNYKTQDFIKRIEKANEKSREIFSYKKSIDNIWKIYEKLAK